MGIACFNNDNPSRLSRRVGCGKLWQAWVLTLWLGLLASAMAWGDTPSTTVAPKTEPDTVVDEARARLAAGQLQEAINLLQTAVDSSDGTQPKRLARQLATLGAALDQAGAVAEAIAVQHQALALYESLDDAAGISAVTSNLGNSLTALGDKATALRYFQDALALKQRHGIRRGVGTIYNNLAKAAEDEGKLDEARATLEKALAAFAEENDPAGAGLAHGNLAQVLARLGHYPEAQTHIGKAEELARSVDSRRGVVAAQIANAEVLMELLRHGNPSNEVREDALKRAEASLQQALATSRSAADEAHHILALDGLSRLYELRGQDAAALVMAREAHSRERAQQQRLTSTRANALSARYEQERQSREIERLRAHERGEGARLWHQRVGLWSLAVLLLAAIGVAWVLWRRARRHRVTSEQLNERTQMLIQTLQDAEAQRQQSETFAMRQRRFLSLASEDLREPLREIRSQAEHLLTETNPDALRRQHASIAQRAADLLWVADQMLESAEHELEHPQAPRHAEVVDWVTEVRELIAQADQRAIHRDQEMVLECTASTAPACVERTRCVVALRELIDILLYLNPARTRFVLSIEIEAAEVRIGLDQGLARLPAWDEVARGQGRGDVTLRLALAWIQHAVQDNGGRIGAVRNEAYDRSEIVVAFPLMRDVAIGAVCPLPSSPSSRDRDGSATSRAQATGDRGSP
ncbi:MAG TPA: tetratricopeptide repeat protein [Chiayiivirga sp.]|nr:tetratricopeptide repeat protein [Chiayiivirga sp.]